MKGAAPPELILVSNGPGELYTWVRPVLEEARHALPATRIAISLIPCQFASGAEARIAEGFGADAITTPAQFLRWTAGGARPTGLAGAGGAVVGLGGSSDLALRIAGRLGYPAYRYSFEPWWNRRLRRLYVHDAAAARKARRLGAPAARTEIVGNLVADAVHRAEPAAGPGAPHVLLMAGSRDGFAVHLIPFVAAVADELARRHPGARFVWPVSRLLSPAAIEAGIAGAERATLGGVASRRDGDRLLAPGGAVIEMIPEEERYAHMRAADVALTIPGTNTLELGIAGLPAVVALPLNRPEIIPLEGPGHWLSLLPVVGVPLKRRAVRLFVEGLKMPVSLPNRFSGEELMTEIAGVVDVEGVADAMSALLEDPAERGRRRARMAATMPGPGAAARLLASVVADLGRGGPAAGGAGRGGRRTAAGGAEGA